jgi:hypothetical protein
MKRINNQLQGNKGKALIYSILGHLIVISGCDNFVQIDPPRTEIVSQTVFTSDASAMAALRGIYSLMMTNQSFTKAGMEEYSGIASDELRDYATRQDQLQFYQNSLSAKNGDVLGVFWREAFVYINNANGILEGLNGATGMSISTMSQLEGEARFIRAFCHFYLVNLFGDVPYIETTDYRINAIAFRLSREEVYKKIENDLLEAKLLMVNDFVFSGGERVQPNKGVATALLARLYLYKGDWVKSEGQATALIDNTDTYSLTSNLDEVFLKNSKEAIWQLMPAIPGTNTPQALLFILTEEPNPTSHRVSLTDDLINAFEASDDRKVSWVGNFTNGTNTWHFPYKYKKLSGPSLTEYAMVFRLAEQYLIRAEARANQNNIEGAQADLNAVRNRAGLSNTAAVDQQSLLSAIEHERRVELFAEWGHRWLDLKRSGRADVVLSPLKADWQTTDVLFPIPQSEILLDPNLLQNPGY